MYFPRRGLGSVSVQDMITSAAARLGVPSSLALAVGKQESGYNQSAVSSAGAIGVFQLMPGTAAGLGVNPYDLAQNIDGGLTYLRQLYDRFGDWRLALQAYNGGPAHVDSGTVSGAAQSYADNVLALAGPLGSSDVSAGVPAFLDLPASLVGDPAALSTPAKLGIAAALVGLALVVSSQ